MMTWSNKRGQEAGGRRQEAGGGGQEAGSRRQRAGDRLCLVFCFLLAACCPLLSGYGAEPIALSSTVDKTKITIGDEINYKLKITYDPKKIKIPTLPTAGEQLKEFAVKDYKIGKPQKKGEKEIIEMNYIITTFTTGSYIISPSTVTYINEQGEKKQISSQKIFIEVESVAPSEAAKEDIKGLKSPREIGWPLWVWGLIFAGIGGGIFGGGWLYRKRFAVKEKLGMASTVPPRSPEEVAYELLAKLDPVDFLKRGRLKEFYIRLSGILRQYLAGRFSIPALDLTTEEIYSGLKEIKIPRKSTGLLKGFLDECDLVKFAKYVPGEERVKKSPETAKQIVDLTTEKKVK